MDPPTMSVFAKFTRRDKIDAVYALLLRMSQQQEKALTPEQREALAAAQDSSIALSEQNKKALSELLAPVPK